MVIRPEASPAQASLYTHWFGNATTALHVALQALQCRGRYIAVTPNVCPNVVAAILATSNFPYFVDIERKRLGLDPAGLENVIEGIGAVIAVHSYGIPCLIDQICEISACHRVPVIEDCAQAEGATVKGKPVGAFGNIAVFSYGAGKIIDAGGGGCATTSDPELSRRITKLTNSLPPGIDEFTAKELALFFKFFYNQLYPDRLECYRAVFTQLLEDFGRRLLAAHDPRLSAVIDAGKAGLSANVDSRRSKAMLYRKLIAGSRHLKAQDPPAGGVYWRFNVLLEPELRDSVLHAMLRERLTVSSWYPDISLFLDKRVFKVHGTLANSHWLGNGVLNLWVDGETHEQDVRRTCDKLLTLTN